jgi:hypothetical protein
MSQCIPAIQLLYANIKKSAQKTSQQHKLVVPTTLPTAELVPGPSPFLGSILNSSKALLFQRIVCLKSFDFT